MILALFSGFFLYVGGSDLLPESHHAHPRLLTTVMTVAGAVLLYIVAQVAA
jgi:zinc transporter ZupT